MRLNSWIPVTFLVAFALIANGYTQERRAGQDVIEEAVYLKVCHEIAGKISSASAVFYHGDAGYMRDITTWSSTNIQQAACSVEPGSAEDVSTIVKILGKTRTPFGIRGGGHSPNPGFTSTLGVLIAMYRFSEVKYDPSHKTAVIGAGLIWDQVYEALEPHSVSVVGGRVSGVGVAGFVLGGGYSWLTNQHGLALDTVVAYELVQPNGNIIIVTKNSYPDLFFGLKGGFNNFGIVTRFTMKTFPQTQVWGGIVMYTEDAIPAIKAAVTKFVDTVTDPKASIITAFNAVPGQVIVAQIIFYDAPKPPAGMFDAFMHIKPLSSNISTRSYLSLVQATPAKLTYGQRNTFDTTPILEYTPKVIDAVINETMFWGSELADKSATIITYAIEPFTPDILSFNTVPSAYPPIRSHGLSPFDISYAWISSEHDNDFITAAKLSASHLHDVVLADGQTAVESGTLYPNYAADGTPLKAMYGSNVPRLRRLKKQYDPDNVMGLAGGFKF